MKEIKQELYSVLRQFNPWWDEGKIPELPSWKRVAFSELYEWMDKPPANRALLLTGARQVGKTTLFLQVIQALLDKEVSPENVLYVTYDHPLIKLSSLDELLSVWREIQPPKKGIEYIFLDEVQNVSNWQVWLKHQVDFEKNRRIAVTGSSIPLETERLESGVGRWHAVRLPTMSFYEYLQIKNISYSELPDVSAFDKIFEWQKPEFTRIAGAAKSLTSHFHDYLIRGGFPQTAQVESIHLAQKLLREDIIDKVLKRDMTALFGVRRVLELEKTFLYLCMHDGGILDILQLSKRLELKRPTVKKFIDLFESAHLIYQLPPYGYGKQILRARFKTYMADPAISGSVLLKGKSTLEDSTRLANAVEAAFYKHIFARYYQESAGFYYWRGKRDLEVDFVAEVQGELIPFEVKYQQGEIQFGDIKGLLQMCSQHKIARGYIISREISDFGILYSKDPKRGDASTTPILKIPAPLACYWLSKPGSA